MTQNLIGEVAIVGTKAQGWYVGKVDDADLTRNSPGVRLTGAYWLGMDRPTFVGRMAIERAYLPGRPPVKGLRLQPIQTLWVFDVVEVAVMQYVESASEVAEEVEKDSWDWAGAEIPE